MTNLINKLLAFFHLKLVYTKPDTSFVKETVKFMNENPEYFSNSLGLGDPLTSCVGEINYVQERVYGEFPQVSGRTYYEEQYYGTNKKFFNCDGEQYYPEELEAKLKND